MLAGKRIYFHGKLSGLARRKATQLVQEKGGTVAQTLSPEVNLIVVGEEELLAKDFPAWIEQLDGKLQAAYQNGELEIQTESAFWKNLSDSQSGDDEPPLFTIPMLAEFLELPIATIRLWYRRGLIVPAAKVHNLAYFDFQEILTAKALRELLRGGLNAAVLEKRLNEIQRMFPDVQRPLAQLAAIVEGKDLLLRKENRLIDHRGQTRIDFDALEFPPDEQSAEPEPEEKIPFDLETTPFSLLADRDPLQCLDSMIFPNGPSAESLCEAALILEAEGDLRGALATYRAALFAEGPDAETCYQVAELLYRLGDLTAARERYYMALEIDEEYVEARAGLGGLLVELGEWELAISAFQGTLSYHPDYADVHFHLGNLLWQHDREEEAKRHFQNFLQLQPDSPWAEKVKGILMRNEK